MNVIDGLATHLVAVHGDAEALLASLLDSQALCGVEDVSGERLVIFVQIVKRGDVFFRDDQEMYRRLRADIMEGNELIIFIELAGGNRTGDDSAE